MSCRRKLVSKGLPLTILTRDWGPSLNSLRGLAVILVFLSHALGHWFELSRVSSGVLQDLHSIIFQVDFGRLGVYLFFLISGYLIPFSVKGVGLPSSNSFLKRRFLRIAPLYFLSIPLGLALEHWLQGRETSGAMIFQNLLLIPNFFSNPYALNAYWTLQIEFIFYLIIYAIAVRFDFKRNKYVFSVAFLVSVLLAEIIRPDHYAASPVLSIFLGEWSKILGGLTFLWLGAFIRNMADQRSNKIEAFLLGLYCIYAAVYLPLKQVGRIDLEADHPTVSFLVPSLAVAIFFFGLLVKARSSFLETVGESSYSMYLLHAPVIFTLKHLLENAILAHNEIWFLKGITLPKQLAGIFFVSAAFLLSYLLSRWSYHQIERRFWDPSASRSANEKII